MHKTGINRIKCDFRGMAMFSVEGVGVGVEGVETGINRIKRDFRRMAMFSLEGRGGGGGRGKGWRGRDNYVKIDFIPAEGVYSKTCEQILSV